ncbi:uncharacterized protein LOC129589693 [Paramacrobiotus metropolitanus]|uniref:uncharacterized protein LOC129589693 n=1 Tax=Paramacrobiotus metropolitanus TaxID=2943436 RepID=UPI002445964C|nr:uncharacterized protein LOC129589693 [Paramacrobiotus metropolitanus]
MASARWKLVKILFQSNSCMCSVFGIACFGVLRLAGLHIQRRGPGEVSSEENVYRWDGMMKAEGYSAPYPSASGGPMQEVFPQMMVETVVKRFSNAEEGGWHQDVEGAPTQTVDHPVETGRSAPTEKDSGLFMNKGLKLKKWKKRGG